MLQILKILVPMRYKDIWSIKNYKKTFFLLFFDISIFFFYIFITATIMRMVYRAWAKGDSFIKWDLKDYSSRRFYWRWQRGYWGRSRITNKFTGGRGKLVVYESGGWGGNDIGWLRGTRDIWDGIDWGVEKNRWVLNM